MSLDHQRKKHNKNGANMEWLRAVVTSPPDGCAIFIGGKFDGYGSVYFEGRYWKAHQVAYTLAFGPIPEGMQINHKCKQSRACCNPSHLYAGTQRQNIDDRVRDGTTARMTGDKHYSHTNPEKRVRGEQHGCAKLDEESVRYIRASRETQKDLSTRFGVTVITINRIIRRATWKCVSG